MPYGKGINWTTSQFQKTTETKLGSANQAHLARLFATSPVNNGYDHKAVVAATNQFINAQSITENTDFPGGIDLNYSGAPDISEAGFDKKFIAKDANDPSLPSTPWTPNITSPGEVPGATNLDPRSPTRPIMENDITAMNQHAVEGQDSMVNPKSTSKEVGEFAYGPDKPIDLGERPGKK